jgi:transcriptional regulator with XRE-family HTH domain
MKMTTYNDIISRKLREAMVAKKLTKAAVSRSSGLSAGKVAGMCNGRSRYLIVDLLCIADAVGLDIREFFKSVGDEKRFANELERIPA